MSSVYAIFFNNCLTVEKKEAHAPYEGGRDEIDNLT